MLLVPDPSTAVMDPFTEVTTLSIIADVEDPITREKYPRDPRNIAKKAEAYLQSTGIADVAYFRPRSRVLRLQRRSATGRAPTAAFTTIDSDEAAWNTGRDEKPNLGYKMRTKEGYFPVPPSDTLGEPALRDGD